METGTPYDSDQKHSKAILLVEGRLHPSAKCTRSTGVLADPSQDTGLSIHSSKR